MMIKINRYRKLNIELISILVIFFSMLLNHSTNILGLNISLSDFFLIAILFLLIYRNTIVAPNYIIVFFISLMIWTLFTTLLISPLKFGIITKPKSVIFDYVKIIISFLYLIIGFNLSKLGFAKLSMKIFSIAGYIIAILGLFYSVFNIAYFRDVLFFSRIRYRGFMVDPNYYSTLLNMSFSYIQISDNYSSKFKIINYILSFLTIVITGSKTGMIVFLVISLLLLILNIYKNKNIIKIITILILLLPLAYHYKPLIIYLSNFLEQYFPSFDRVSQIFTNISDAISVGGSNRDSVLKQALIIFKNSPLFGVGIGTFQSISLIKFGNNTLAHNTYLQLLAEWGIIFTLLFFGFIFIKMFNSLNSKEITGYQLSIYMLIMLISSMSLSLNNARMFWFFLGVMIKNQQRYDLKLKKCSLE